MKHLSAATTTRFFGYARRGALLLALSAAGPMAWGQSFAPASLYLTGTGTLPRTIALGDVNRDGRLDIVTACFGTGAAGVLLSLPTTGFAPLAPYSTGLGTFPLAVALRDMNGDGFLDIISANNDYNPGHAGVLLGQAAGFGTTTLYAANPIIGPCAVTTGDLNADGVPDIAAVNNFTDEVRILAGQANGFAASSTAGTGTGSMPIDVALGDVNQDGRLDIVTANANQRVSVLLAQAGGGFAAASTYATGNASTPRSLALGDVNGDGRLDIAVGDDGLGYVGVLLGQASGFASITRYATGGTSTNCVALGDMNGDGRLDIVATDYLSNTVVAMLGQAGGFAPARTYPTTSNSATSQPLGLALGDINGDGRPDIVVANSYNNTVGVLLNTGTYTPLGTARPTVADLVLAPNPAHEAFTVQLPTGFAPTQAELLNGLGQVVRRLAANGPRFTVETSGLAPGLYILRLQAGDTALAKRVVVE
jgi:hypothetical protein